MLERCERLGGACTLERPFTDERYVVSPCAYVVGLLDRLVIDELELGRHGYRVTPADPNLWCPLPGGGSFALFIEPARTSAYLRDQGFADAEIEGLLAYERVFERCRLALRQGDGGDTWLAPSPARDELERILGDEELVSLVFEDSIADVLDRYVGDERLKHALFAQGLIGTFAGPATPAPRRSSSCTIRATCSASGRSGATSRAAWAAHRSRSPRRRSRPARSSRPGCPSRASCRARGAGRVGRADPGADGDLQRRSEADAGDARRLGRAAGRLPAAAAAWDTDSPVVKLNVALNRMPAFTAAEGTGVEPQRAMVTITPGLDAAQAAVESCRRGEPAFGFAELYFQSAYDDSVVPPGREVMSVFAQFAPYELADDWDSRRDEIGALLLDEIAVYAPDVRDCVDEPGARAARHRAPHRAHRRAHLPGQALPGQMWDRRLEAVTPVEGLYLCGAATHPGGSVIGLNGRIAAMAVLGRTRSVVRTG